MLTMSGNLLSNIVIAHVESTGARRRGKSSAAEFVTDYQRNGRGRRRRERVGVRRRGRDDFAGKGVDTGAERGGYVTGTENRQQAMNSLEMEEWRKTRTKKKCEKARPNDKVLVGARMIYKNMRKDGGMARSKCTKVDLSLKGSGRSKRCTTRRRSTRPPHRLSNPDTFGDGGG